MTTRKIPEADWKKFRKLREVALERFCDRTLQEITTIAANDAASSHQRYLKIYDFIQAQDQDLSRAFDAPRRSQMLEQLIAMQGLGLFTTEDLDQFTDATREVLDFLFTPETR
ncbi:MAG: peptide ABC transporter substrate-binding protein [Cyanobacteria bacterium P01_G01_bin.54]